MPARGGSGVSRAYSIRVGGEGLSFSEAIKTCFQKYAEFRGRASRPEFWWFVLLYYLVILVPIVPLIAVGSIGRGDQPWDEADINVGGVVFGIVIGVAVLALIIPYLAAGAGARHREVRVVVVDHICSLWLDHPDRVLGNRWGPRVESIRATSGCPSGTARPSELLAAASAPTSSAVGLVLPVGLRPVRRARTHTLSKALFHSYRRPTPRSGHQRWSALRKRLDALPPAARPELVDEAKAVEATIRSPSTRRCPARA